MKRIDKDKLYSLITNKTERNLERCNTASAAITVAQGGEVVFDGRFGYKNIERGEKLCGGETFRLASMTKPIAGVAFLKAVELGYFAPDDRLYDYIPEVKNMKVGRIENGRVVPNKLPDNDILLYHLLSHQSGFMASSPMEALQYKSYSKETHACIESIVNYTVKNTCLTFEPGCAVGYATSIPFDAIAVIVERKSGLTWGEFLEKHIFNPLGIKDITFHPTDEQWERCVTMYDRAVGTGLVSVDMGRHIFECHPLSYEAAGAGLLGSAEDYFVFAEMLRGNGEYRGVRIISKDTFDLLCKPLVTKEIMEGTYLWGLGVRVMDGDNVLPDGAFGWSGAYGTHFWVDPTNDITAIFMRNMRWHDTHGAGSIGREFERAVMSALIE